MAGTTMKALQTGTALCLQSQLTEARSYIMATLLKSRTSGFMPANNQLAQLFIHRLKPCSFLLQGLLSCARTTPPPGNCCHNSIAHIPSRQMGIMPSTMGGFAFLVMAKSFSLQLAEACVISGII